jgi:hypothetical protein
MSVWVFDGSGSFRTCNKRAISQQMELLLLFSLDLVASLNATMLIRYPHA